VEAGATKEVQVIMQAQRDPPPSLADCRDKFLVQAVRVGGEATEVTPDMFDAARARDIRQTKLRVVLVAPAKPPSPVPEGVEDSLEASPGGSAAAGVAAPAWRGRQAAPAWKTSPASGTACATSWPSRSGKR